uniref:uncharacterized protein n=1 Tax=Myxine glutinosa TaxID=7769 RepID=UPI00358F13EC
MSLQNPICALVIGNVPGARTANNPDPDWTPQVAQAAVTRAQAKGDETHINPLKVSQLDIPNVKVQELKQRLVGCRMRLRWIALCACLVLGLGIMRAEDDDLDVEPDLDLDQEPYEDEQDHDLRNYAHLDDGIEQDEEETVQVPPVSKAPSIPKPGIVGKLYQAADERPWLWAVYVFTVALPILLLVSFCWPNKKFVPSDGDAKKSDAVQPDDPKEGDEDEEQDGEEDKEENDGARCDEVDAKKSSESEPETVKGEAEHKGSQEDEDEEEDEDEVEGRTERKTAKSKSDLESEGEPQTQVNDADGGKMPPRKRKLRKE